MSDGITQALQSIQPELNAGADVAQIGSTAYNLYNQHQNQQYQNQLRSYAQDPAKMRWALLQERRYHLHDICSRERGPKDIGCAMGAAGDGQVAAHSSG